MRAAPDPAVGSALLHARSTAPVARVAATPGPRLALSGRTPLFAAHAPALVFFGDHYASLSVVRSLGRLGVEVTLADASLFSRAGCSRFVHSRRRCPPADDTARFLEWLLTFGDKHPGHVLFPANDALAWLFSRHEDALRKRFHLFAPPAATLARILDKKHLHDACARVGLDFPRTFCPRSWDELGRLEATLQFPVLLKPRTQILLRSGTKGGVVQRAQDLRPAVSAYLREDTFGEALLAHDSSIAWPMIQEFFVGAEHGIYGLSGFADGRGALVLRGASKILQRPRRLGIGVCFEEARVDPALAASVAALFHELGYFGIFEIEFIVANGKNYLIDFNPRPFSQMAFDEARGVDLALFHYLAATGQSADLRRRLDELAEPKNAGAPHDQDARIAGAPADAPRPNGALVYHHRFLLDLIRAGQMAHGVFGGPAREPWDAWLDRHRGRATDAVRASDDPIPVAADLLKQGVDALRHPRAYLRSLMRGEGGRFSPIPAR